MTATNHAINGVVIAIIVKKPELAIPLAFLSHFLADLVPHFNARSLSASRAKSFIAADVIIATGLTILLPLLLRHHLPVWITFVCMWAAMSPDIIWGWRFWRKKDINKVFTDQMSRLSRLHMKLQWSDTRQGFFVEAAWLAGMIYILISLTE